MPDLAVRFVSSTQSNGCKLLSLFPSYGWRDYSLL